MKRLSSAEHFSVDGTLIEAWASMKSFKPKDGADEPPAEGGGRNERNGLPRRGTLERDACFDDRRNVSTILRQPDLEFRLGFLVF